MNQKGLGRHDEHGLENGRKNNPSTKTLQKIAKALGVSVTELFNELNTGATGADT
ncbi:MAG: helix-turn-helix domain-containing protein [Bacillota bacterium]